MKNTFKVNYVTTLPKLGNVPSISIIGCEQHKYQVLISEKINENWVIVNSGYCETNNTIIFNNKQWVVQWKIDIIDEFNNIVFTELFNPRGKVVFIKFDAWALGDTIAWIPYVEEFRKKHDCIIICSTFYNSLFINVYPDILFVKPNTIINNVYAQYYVGATDENNPYYSPIKVSLNPLQDVASKILDLPSIELRPNLDANFKNSLPNISGKYVTLSEFGSSKDKHWKDENGWQIVVNHLNANGYKVVVISKEKTNLTGIIDKTGDIDINERCIDITHAEMHLGISSGLSWLAWGLGTHVIMISDVTPNWHEFKSGITRINNNKLDRVNYNAIGVTSVKEVIEKLVEMGIGGYL